MLGTNATHSGQCVPVAYATHHGREGFGFGESHGSPARPPSAARGESSRRSDESWSHFLRRIVAMSCSGHLSKPWDRWRSHRPWAIHGGLISRDNGL